MKDLAELFDEREGYLRKLKKESYEINTQRFDTDYGPALRALLESAGASGDTAGSYVSEALDFSRKIYDKYEKKGKINSILLMDLNFMMVYYVFPYLLKNKDKGGEEFAAVLKDKWNETMGSNISYTTYEDLYSGFKKKLFGFF